MNPVRIVICDDDYATIVHTKSLLSEYLEYRGIAYELQCFDDGELCLYYLQQHDVDLIFLDIFLRDGQLGTELAATLRTFNREAKLIFLSTSNEFATESFAVNASFYLLKPLSMEKLQTALNRCNLTSAEISIDTGRELITLNPALVIALEVQNKYTFVHTTNGLTKFICPLAKFTEYLHEPDFLMIHRSYVINLHHVASIEDGYFLMKNGFKASMTLRNSKTLRDTYLEWVISHI